MAVKLRLRREGTTKKPHYRVVAADSRSPRDGRFIEIIGHYHPMQEPSGIDIDGERALYWLNNGAQPTAQVEKLLRITGVWEEFKPGDEPKRVRTETPKVSKKAKERAAEQATKPEATKPEATQPEATEEQVEEAPEQAATDQAQAEDAPAEQPTDDSPAEAQAEQTADDAEDTDTDTESDTTEEPSA